MCSMDSVAYTCPTVTPEFFLDPEGSLSATMVVLVLLVVVTHFRKMPKALLISNGKLRNFAYTFMTLFPTDLQS